MTDLRELLLELVDLVAIVVLAPELLVSDGAPVIFVRSSVIVGQGHRDAQCLLQCHRFFKVQGRLPRSNPVCIQLEYLKVAAKVAGQASVCDRGMRARVFQIDREKTLESSALEKKQEDARRNRM